MSTRCSSLPAAKAPRKRTSLKQATTNCPPSPRQATLVEETQVLHKHTKQDQSPSHHYNGAVRILTPPCGKPAIAQLAEHLTVECCSNQMVPGSIPGGRIMSCDQLARNERIHTVAAPTETSTSKDTPAHQPPQNPPLPHSWHACKKVMTNRGAKPPTFRSHGDPCTLLAVARKQTTSEEILL